MVLTILLSLLIAFNANILNNPENIRQFQINDAIEIADLAFIQNKKSIGVKLESQSGMVINEDTGEILFSKNEKEKLPIASISKLMSALVFLDNNPGWDSEIKITKDDYRKGGRLYVSEGEIIRVKDLFYASLIGSANNATIALARSTGMSLDEFVLKMNEKAQFLEMKDSQFKEPTGLSEHNISTALDIVKLAKASFAQEEIQDALKTEKYIFSTVDKKIEHIIKNTDKLLNSFLNKDDYSIIGAKTGYTEEAGYCLVLSVKDDLGNQIISVVLGNSAADKRFQEAKSLAWWALSTKQEGKKP